MVKNPAYVVTFFLSIVNAASNSHASEVKKFHYQCFKLSNDVSSVAVGNVWILFFYVSLVSDFFAHRGPILKYIESFLHATFNHDIDF